MSRPSIEDAAHTAGVAEKTLRRWMREPGFNAEYLRAGKAYQPVARMPQASSAAGLTMLKLMTDPNVPVVVRLRAAECVFDRAIKGIELEDVETRLAALEKVAAQSNSRR